MAKEEQETGPPEEHPPSREASSFADRLNRLFVLVRPDDSDREYTPEDIAQWVRAHGGPTISARYVYMLRRGERDNPTRSHIDALARFFQVTPAFFFDDALSERVEEELELLNVLRDADVRAVALRTSQLSDDARRSVADIVSSMAEWASRPAARLPTFGDSAGRARPAETNNSDSPAAQTLPDQGAVVDEQDDRRGDSPAAAEPDGSD